MKLWISDTLYEYQYVMVGRRPESNLNGTSGTEYMGKGHVIYDKVSV